MVALLVGLSIMAVALSIALPTWSTMAKREREEELIFRGQQYARAITLYQRRFANAYPANIDILVEQKFLRKKFKDPMTADGEFQPVFVGQPIPGQATAPGQQGQQQGQQGPQGSPQAGQRGGVLLGTGRSGGQATFGQQQGRTGGGAGIMGVVSKSEAASMRLYNNRSKYSEWVFVATPAVTQAGSRDGGQGPVDGRGGRRGGADGPRRGGPASPGGRRGF